MTKAPWTKFYWSDWLAGTSGLTAAERGVYVTMLALIYENGGPVAFDASRLSRRCGVPAGSFKRVFEALVADGKLELTDDGLVTNQRAERELGEREIEHTKRQSGAHKTNAILAEKRQQNQSPEQRIANATRAPVPEARSQIPDIPSKEGRARVARAPSKSKKEEADKALVFARFWPKALATWKQLGAAPGSKADAFAVWMKKLTLDQGLTAEAVLPLLVEDVAEQRRTFPEYNPKNVCRWLWNGKHNVPGPYSDHEDKVDHAGETAEDAGDDAGNSRASWSDQHQRGMAGEGAAVERSAPGCGGRTDGPGPERSERSAADPDVVGVLPPDRAAVRDQVSDREADGARQRTDGSGSLSPPERTDGGSGRRHGAGTGSQIGEQGSDAEPRTAQPNGRNSQGSGVAVAIPTPPPADPHKLHNVVDLERRKWRTQRPQGAPGRTLGQILAVGT